MSKEKNNLKEIISILEYSISKIKNNGKDSIIYCDEKIEYELRRKNYIIDLMRKEIENNGFEVYYQPIYDVKKGIFTKAEALARIKDNEIGLVSPKEFIPIAEETGLIFDIGYIILGKTCAFLKKIEKENIKLENISVNFSPLQFEISDVVNKIKNIITYYNVNPQKICIEITEDIMFDRNDDIIMKIKELHNWGIKFYLDDFGTGYSNISRVIQFPFDIIKIDKSIIDNCVKNNETYIILKALTSAFSNVNAKVLVEGVETEQQKEDIEILCNYIQGFYFSEPIPDSKVLKFFGG